MRHFIAIGKKGEPFNGSAVKNLPAMQKTQV